MFTHRVGLVSSYSFADTEASKAKPAVVGEVIREMLRDDATWAAIEPYLKPPGVCGSKSYDQANVIRNLLEIDSDIAEKSGTKGKLSSFGLSDRELWIHVYRELKKAGFQTSHGRVTGLLEGPEKRNAEPADVHNPGNGGDVE